MKDIFSIITFFFLLPTFAFGQDNSFRAFIGWEPIGGDFVGLDATIGLAIRNNISNYLYYEPFLQVGYGGLLLGSNYSQSPENYIGKPQAYVFEGQITYDMLQKGISNKVHDTHLLIIMSGMQLGIQTQGNKYRAYLSSGLSLSYLDHQTIGEAGDAIFNYNGQEYIIWYTVPAYQRGIGLSTNVSVGAEKLWKNWFLGIRADVSFGAFRLAAIGNRHILSLTIGVPL